MNTKFPLLLKWLVVACLSLGSYGLQAQKLQWTTYLAGQRVTSVTEDATNWYIGTKGGLIRINKQTQEQTFLNEVNSGLPSVSVESIAKKPSGEIWVGTYDAGIAVMHPEGKWTVMNTENGMLPTNRINQIIFKKDGSACIASSEGVFYQKDGKWEAINTSNHHWGFTSVVEGDNGDIWYGGNHTLGQFTGDTTISHFENFVYGTADVTKDAQNRIWARVGTEVGFWDGSKWTLFSSHDSSLPGDGNIQASGINNEGEYTLGRSYDLLVYTENGWESRLVGTNGSNYNFLNDMRYDAAGNIWASDGRRLSMWNGSKWSNFALSNSALASNYMQNVASDGKGKIYAQTLGAEFVSISEEGSIKFMLPQPLTMTSWTSMSVLADGRVAVATSSQGLFIFDGAKWEEWSTEKGNAPADQIYCMDIDQNGNIWLGTRFNGVLKFDGEQFTEYRTVNSELPANEIHVIHAGTDGKIYAATTDQSLSIFDGTAWKNEKLGSFFNSNNIWSMASDKEGNLWIGSYGRSLARFDGANLTYANEMMGMTSEDWSRVTAIHIDKNGRIWAAVDAGGGVLYFDGKQSHLLTYENSPLPSDDITDIIAGSENEIIVATRYSSYTQNQGGGLAIITTEAQTSGIQEQPVNAAWQVYPNPAHDQVQVRFDNIRAGCIQMSLYAADGRLVWQTNQAVANGQISLNVAGLPAGMYILQANSGDQVIRERLLVK